MERHRSEWTGDEDNLTDVLWRQMQSIADAMHERQAVLGRKKPDPALREGINLFIVDVISHWIDRLARESDPGHRQELEHLLRVVGAESRRPWIDAPDRTMAGVSA
jgi:hypothetical protein